MSQSKRRQGEAGIHDGRRWPGSYSGENLSSKRAARVAERSTA